MVDMVHSNSWLIWISSLVTQFTMRTILFTFRMQQSIVNARVLIITLALVLLTICLLTYIPEVQNTMASVNSWRNVSAYHLLKMHLSARPSHVTSLRKSYCRTLAVAKFNESLLNFNQVSLKDVMMCLVHASLFLSFFFF